MTSESVNDSSWFFEQWMVSLKTFSYAHWPYSVTKEIKCNEKILCEWDSGNVEIRHKQPLYQVEHWRANNRATIVLQTTNNTHTEVSTYICNVDAVTRKWLYGIMWITRLVCAQWTSIVNNREHAPWLPIDPRGFNINLLIWIDRTIAGVRVINR